ncbi:MAG TPA: hypothetical protein VHM26_12595 [Chitinophagaceae bacterium]|jgi:hypothetical protein|nr:hypothetical protein [Chitinophagaceae bacterium]
MRKNTSIILLGFSFLFTSIISAQNDNLAGGNSFANDINGRPLYLKTEYRAEGSPYYYDDYSYADITSLEGKVYKAVLVKLDLVENLILYKTEDGKEMIASTPLKKIRFYSSVIGEKMHPGITLETIGGAINAEKAKVFEVLAEGKAKLLKQVSVTYSDDKLYGESTITRKFKRATGYYSVVGGSEAEPKKLTRSKPAIIELFSSQKDSVRNYIDDHKLDCKSEEDLIKIFEYYQKITNPSAS